MSMRILIIGGYGVLGSCIARHLAPHEDFQLIIAGRNRQRAEAMAKSLGSQARARAECLDINSGISEKLFELKPVVVIHTAGPFRDQGYQVASACMEIGAHYIDLATDPGFVGGVAGLRNTANDKNVLMISGASASPCLIAAMIDQCQKKFKLLDTVESYHSKSLTSLHGLASAADLLGQLGHEFGVLVDSQAPTVYGWQRCRLLPSKLSGRRLVGSNAGTIPSAFLSRFPSLSTCQFFEGVDVKLLHLALWLLSWGGRFRRFRHFDITARLLQRAIMFLDRFSPSVDVFYLRLTGQGLNDQAQALSFEVVAKSGHGIDLQCLPAVILTRKLLHGELQQSGVVPCVGLVSLKEYIDECANLEISWKLTDDTPESEEVA